MTLKKTARVPARPFADWLKYRASKNGGIKHFAETIDEDQMWLGKLIKMEFKTVEIRKVDSILCKDDTTHIRELYPEIYED